MNRSVIYFCLIFAGHSGFAGKGNGEIDKSAIQREKTKRITPVNEEKLEQEYRDFEDALNEFDQENHEEGNWDEYQFIDEKYRLSKAQKAAEKARDEERNRALQEAEGDILRAIRAYEMNSKYAAVIKNMRQAWLESWKAKQSGWPSDLALELARYFEKLDETTTAIYFYQLASRSPQVDFSFIDFECGRMLLRKYNELVENTRPTKPNAQIFSAARIGANYLESGSHSCELGSFLARELKEKRDMMVRWAISPQLLIKDTYYPPSALLKRIYSPHFVDRLLCDVSRLTKLFTAFHFTNNNKHGDLLNALVENGFYGVKRVYQMNPQFIWVSKDGYVVRVKKSEDKTKWEFTVGLAFQNPFEWQGNKAIRSLTAADIGVLPIPFFDDLHPNDEMVTAQYNEMFKVVVDVENEEQLVMLTPAFRNFYWAGFDMREELLAKAHKTLGYVGKSTKKGINWSAIDAACGFKERK